VKDLRAKNAMLIESSERHLSDINFKKEKEKALERTLEEL